MDGDTSHIRKRRRKVLSCVPCHRQKIKCNRHQPCSRCIAGHRETECIYDCSPPPPPLSAPLVSPFSQGAVASSESTSSLPLSESVTLLSERLRPQTPEDIITGPLGSFSVHETREDAATYTFTIYRKGRARFCGWTHWAQLFYQFEEIRSMIGSDPFNVAGWRPIIKGLKKIYPGRIPRMFPLGSGVCNRELMRKNPLSLLPPRNVVEYLVGIYLETFELGFPLLDVYQFRQELDDFWTAPINTETAWLAQLFLILAIGCYGTATLDVTIVPDYAGLAKQCMDGAESTFLSGVEYMCKPSLAASRLLCFIAIAKRLNIVTRVDSDDVWTYFGFVIRIFMTQGFHMALSSLPRMDRQQIILRQRMWSTVMKLGIMSSFQDGMPFLLQPSDIVTPPKSLQTAVEADFNGNQATNPASPSISAEDLLQKAAPILITVLNKVNSPSPRMDQKDLHLYEMTVIHLLQSLECTPQAHSPQSQLTAPPKIILSILLRRALLALHHNCVVDPSTCFDVAHSQRVLIDTSIILATQHRFLYSQPELRWITNLFYADFGMATIHIGLYLRKLCKGSEVAPGTPGKAACWDAIMGTETIFRNSIALSTQMLKCFKGFVLLRYVLQSLEEQTNLAEAVQKGGMDVIETVRNHFGPMQPTPVGSAAPVATVAPSSVTAGSGDGMDIVGMPEILGSEIELVQTIGFGVDDLNLSFDDYLQDMFSFV